MSTFRSWRWSILAVAFGLSLSAAQAEMITPDSIPNRPAPVGSANGTTVSMGNEVTTQYGGLGLHVSAAITSLNNVSVWAPMSYDASPPWGGAINYASSVGGRFVSPGSSNPMTVSSLSVVIRGYPPVSMNVYGLNGQTLNISPTIESFVGGIEVWTFQGPGISSFSAAVFSPPGYAHPAAITSPWGVEGISFTPAATTPEPSSLVLAGLGALGLAARFGWRRERFTRLVRRMV